MKKVLILLTASSLMVGILGFYPNLGKGAVMEGIYLDQKNEFVSGGGAMTIASNNRRQTFKPTVSLITSAEVYLKNRKEGSKLMGVIKDSTGKAISTSEEITLVQANQAPNAWETISFPAPYGPYTPESTYTLVLSINDSQTQWTWNDGNKYDRGQALGGSSPSTQDFLFRIYGKLESASLNADHPATGSNASSGTAADQSIKSPTLGYVLKNGSKIEAPIDKTIEVTSKDSLKVAGNASSGLKVVLFVGDETYSGTADEGGTWEIEIDTSKLKEDIFTVSAEARVDDAKASEKAELFKLKKVTEKAAATASPNFLQELLTKYFPYLMGVLAALLTGFLATLYYLIKHRKSIGPKIEPLKKAEGPAPAKKKIRLIQN